MYLVGGKKNKNKNLDFDSRRRKKIKKSWKVTLSIENQQIPYIFMQFLEKNPLFFVHVGGKNKKRMKCQIFFLVGHDFTTSEDLVDQTI